MPFLFIERGDGLKMSTDEQPQAEPSQQLQQPQIENIRVAVRLRPFTEREKQKGSKRIVDIERNTVALYGPKNGSQDEPKKFTFDYSYWSHDGFKRRPEDGVNVPDFDHPNGKQYVSQEKVFEDLGLFLMENALHGYDSALLAYGQTGSGKSYTVSGYGTNEGILPRFAREIFAELNKRMGLPSGDSSQAQHSSLDSPANIKSDQTASEEPSHRDNASGEKEPAGHDSGDDKKSTVESQDKNQTDRYEIYFSMIEIYNEVVRDLLAKDHSSSLHQAGTQATIARRGLKVREHPKRGFFVENLTSIKCANKEEIEQLIEEGQLNKSIVATSMNETSSRGHTIYEFRVRQYRRLGENQSDNGESVTASIVQLVDLAGSERMAVHATMNPLVDLPPISSRSNSPFNESNRDSRTATPSRRNRSTISRSKTTRVPQMSASSVSTSTSGGSIMRSSKNNAGSVMNPGLQNQHLNQRFKESVSINQSLSALGNCIQVLSQYSQQLGNNSSSQHKPPKIPYRDSVLTKLLNRCCLSGNSKVVIIATLSPADANHDDTLSTLRFADRAKQIKTHAVVNRLNLNRLEGTRKAELVKALQRENETLKQLVDGRVTTTKSDDSSQTSNFDDSENMIDNFNGPSGTTNESRSLIGRITSKSSDATLATPTRGRITGRKRLVTTGGDASRNRSRSKPAKGASDDPKPDNRLPSSSSIAALGIKESPMSKLVSPASNRKEKLGDRGRNLSVDEGENSEWDNGDGDFERKIIRGEGMLRKSVSLNEVGDEDQSPALLDRILADDSFELADLLGEIDFNDLAANDEAGLLSPESEDSFAALAEQGLSHEEKINLLNKMLTDSNLADKIRKQYERQQLRSQRPKRAGENRTKSQSNADDVQKRALMNAKLKESNPYLSNLNQDEQLTGMITFIIKEGETIVGKNQDCDIVIFGPDLRGRHAKLTRMPIVEEGNSKSEEKEIKRSETFLEPILDSSDEQKSKRVALMINGEPVTKRARLNHGDRLLLGAGTYFVFVDTANAKDHQNPNLDTVTYDMAHGEVLRKVMSDATNEAVIKEIKDYTHRPGTGKARPQRSHNTEEMNKSPSAERQTHGEAKPESLHSLERRLTRTKTIQLEANDPDVAAGQEAQQETEENDDSFKDKLMEDTYEFAMPVAEVNAIAKEMGIRVTYGMKIFTGEEQFPTQESLASDFQNYYTESFNGSDTMSGSTSTNTADDKTATKQEAPEDNRVSSGKYRTTVTRTIRPETLDVAPDLYIHVHLDDFDIDFYWNKEKFQERRIKMLEMYGAWDVGGKPGLVEHLIEQSKYQGYCLQDPFVDDLLTSFVLIGHAQVTLQPLAHMSDMEHDFDVLDVNDEIVGSLRVLATPCHPEETPGNENEPFKTMDDRELEKGFIENPKDLLGKKSVFLLKLISCHDIPSKYCRIFCQYSLDRENSIVRTMIQRDDSFDIDIYTRSAGSSKSQDSNKQRSSREQKTDQIDPTSTDKQKLGPLQFNHSNYLVIEKMNQDILDFLEHGFLTIQVVGQYRIEQKQPAVSSSSNQVNISSPTVVSMIIQSINKYKYRIEQQSNMGSANNGMSYPGSIYANSLTDSAKSHQRITSGGIPKSNSDAPSIASTSATANLFDNQNDEDDTINGLSQENIIDMILTKRKLDRAENQLVSISCC